MIEKWKIFIDNNGSCGALLTDLSKAFDCLPHDLLLTQLHAYGLDLKSLKPLSSYLTNRKHRVRIGNVYSTWSDILTRVPQGSIFGPLLFNIFLCDLFLFLNEIDVANYADDNTPFSCKNDPRNVILDIEHASSVLFNWCLNNGMKPNPDKYHFLHTAKDDLTIKIDQFEIKGSKKEKLLGVTIDNQLTFEPHVKNLCNKVSLKLNALARVSHYINFNQRRLIMKAFITSQFGYCPLVWMFHTRRSNNRINRLHERALRITYEDFGSTFQELLVKYNSVSIHHRNLQVFATLLYKIINNLSPLIVKETFPIKGTSHYNLSLRFPTEIQARNVHTVRYGTESLSFLAPKIWALVPENIKNASSIELFKQKIKGWNLNNCPCRLCKTFVQQIGFI